MNIVLETFLIWILEKMFVKKNNNKKNSLSGEGCGKMWFKNSDINNAKP